MQFPIIHQQEVSQFEQIVSSGRLNRTFLIIGGKDSGKTFLAFRFVSAILGNSKRSNPNLHFFQGSKGEFKDKIDEFLACCEKAPFSGNHNVVLFDDFDRIPQSATNSLLKTLEEPCERTTIILTASSKDTLLDTIISRSFIFLVRQYSMEEKREILWSKGIRDSRRRLQIVDDIKLCLSDSFSDLEKTAKKSRQLFSTLQKCPDADVLKLVSEIADTVTPKAYYSSIRCIDDSIEFQQHISSKLSALDSYASPFLNVFSHAIFLRNEYKRIKESSTR